MMPTPIRAVLSNHPHLPSIIPIPLYVAVTLPLSSLLFSFVTLAKAGIHGPRHCFWIPAFVGMTLEGVGMTLEGAGDDGTKNR
ncbi:hypothetical protein L6Q85_06740 [bacterium]|nr:hypothetical protein [bacterium]